MAIKADEILKPAVGTCLCKNGCVVENGKLLDSLGRWHGLLCLVVEKDGAWPDVKLWKEMLPKEAAVLMVLLSSERVGRVSIYYKLEETPPPAPPQIARTITQFGEGGEQI
jgi:hypothetical protein